jgi:hypothetical protein
MPSASVQKLFRSLANRWQPSIRVAGVLAEDHGLPDRFCSAGYFRNLTTGDLFSVFEDLGPGSTDCHLEGAGALAAAAAVRKDIATGCDLVILSKFGKMEAAGEGLLGAFEATMDAGVPLLTSVSPAFEAAFRRVVPLPFSILSGDSEDIHCWWWAVQRG